MALVVATAIPVAPLVVAMDRTERVTAVMPEEAAAVVSAVAVLAVPDGWARLDAGGAVLTAFAVPRGAAPDTH